MEWQSDFWESLFFPHSSWASCFINRYTYICINFYRKRFQLHDFIYFFSHLFYFICLGEHQHNFLGVSTPSFHYCNTIIRHGTRIILVSGECENSPDFAEVYARGETNSKTPSLDNFHPERFQCIQRHSTGRYRLCVQRN